MSLPRRVVALVTLAALVQSTRAVAFSRTGGVWRTLPVTWYWNPSTIPASIGTEAGRMAMEAGFATWSSAPCTSFRATNAGTTTLVRGSTRDRQNTFTWISGSWPPELGAVNSVIGVTLPVSSGGSNIDADIMYNAVGFMWSLDGARGTVDTQSIAVHEEGHFLGLGHTTVPRESIMFPSYPGRPSRVMSSDDINGVCTLYPGSGPRPDAGIPPPFDAGTPQDPCNAITSCGECTPQATCGWCSSTRTCMTGVVSGPTRGSCPSGWAPFPMNCSTTPPPVDSGTTPRDAGAIDPCAGYASCGTCAAALNCGWCGAANRCMYATMASGPARETCAGGWAIEPSVCPGGGSGTTMFGGACRGASDCSSGGPCVAVGGGTPFCSQRCEDDCNCPRGYRCLMASATLSLCIPGNNTCVPMMPDSGGVVQIDVPATPDVRVPPQDLGTPERDVPAALDASLPPEDAVVDPADVDTDAPPADVDDGTLVGQPGCSCRVGAVQPRARVAVTALAIAFAAMTRRRRMRQRPSR